MATTLTRLMGGPRSCLKISAVRAGAISPLIYYSRVSFLTPITKSP